MTGGYFVTGTTTGIGKTIASTVLTLGLNAYYWKPIQTGAQDGTDSGFIRNWIPSERVLTETYLFMEPLSPHLSAKLNNNPITLRNCISHFDSIKRSRFPIVVEGAGGILVPLSSRNLLVDLVKALDLPVIIIAGTELGTINHSLLTIESLKSRNINIAGVITNGRENINVQKAIKSHGQVEILGHLPLFSTFSLKSFKDAFNSINLFSRPKRTHP